MHRAAKDDNYYLITYLRDKKNFDIMEVDSGGNTPLHYACGDCADWAIHWLLAFKADINAQNKKGQTPLHLLATSDKLQDLKTMRELIFNGADREAIDSEGRTPLEAFQHHAKHVSEKFHNGVTELLDPEEDKVPCCECLNKPAQKNSIVYYCHLTV